MDGLVWEGGKVGKKSCGYFFLGLKRREDKVKRREEWLTDLEVGDEICGFQ